MMRSMWISLGLLALITAFAASGAYAMEHSISQMEDVLGELKHTSVVKASESILSLESIFEKRHTLFATSLPMEDVDAVRCAIILLKNASEKKDTATYESAICSLEFALYRLRDAAIPSFETIF